MPRLLTQPARRKTSAKRRIEYQAPSSPFQKLIDGQRLKLGLSFADISEQVSEISRTKVHRATFWIWLHTRNGFPHPKSFKPAHIKALAKALKIPEPEILRALDASRHLYTPQENPAPQEAQDSLQTLVDTLRQIKKRNVSRTWVLNLALRLQKGAAAPAPPAPKR